MPQRSEAEIGFMSGDGSWSYVGRGVLDERQTERTVNFDWDLTADDYGMTTALHETQRRTIATFGAGHTVMVLFEEVDGELRYVAGDDDSGADRNLRVSAKLFRGRRYVVRVRLYYPGESGEFAVMY